jgi:hypothetical protein
MNNSKNIRKIEEALVLNLKTILDKDHNFARPLSEFWKGCTKEQTCAYNHYGVWFSGEGSTTISGDYAAYYYDYTLNGGHPLLQEFMKQYDLKLYWYDCGTPFLIFKDDDF